MSQRTQKNADTKAAAKPTPQQSGAITGFALALAARAVTDGRPALWIQTDFAALEAGLPYGPGLDLFGLPLRHLLILRVSRPLDLLWAFEEALKSRGYRIEGVELAQVPRNTVKVEGEDASRVLKLVDLLEELDDVSKVFSNFDIDASHLAEAET